MGPADEKANKVMGEIKEILESSDSSDCSGVDKQVLGKAIEAIGAALPFLTQDAKSQAALAMMKALDVGQIDNNESSIGAYFAAISEDAFARMNRLSNRKPIPLDAYHHLRNLWMSAKGAAATAQEFSGDDR